MIDWFFQAAQFIAVGGGVLALLLGLLGRLPSLVSLTPLALTVVGLIVQAFLTMGILIAGGTAKGDVIEFYGYLLTALLVGVGAGFWALAERSKFSTMIMGAAKLTIAVMLLRMWQIWFGV